MSDNRHALAWGVRGGRLMFILSAIDPDVRTITENHIDPKIGEPYASQIVAELNRMTAAPVHPPDCATCRASGGK